MRLLCEKARPRCRHGGLATVFAELLRRGAYCLMEHARKRAGSRLSLYLVSLESVRLSVQLSGSSSLGADAGMAGFSLSLARINYDVRGLGAWVVLGSPASRQNTANTAPAAFEIDCFTSRCAFRRLAGIAERKKPRPPDPAAPSLSVRM